MPHQGHGKPDETPTPEKPPADEPDMQPGQPDRCEPSQTVRERTTDDGEPAASGHGSTAHETKVQEEPELDQPDSQPAHPDTKEPGTPHRGHREPAVWNNTVN